MQIIKFLPDFSGKFLQPDFMSAQIQQKHQKVLIIIFLSSATHIFYRICVAFSILFESSTIYFYISNVKKNLK